MEKQMLRCDICGGELEMQGGGKAVCASCGMKYSTESLREKFNGLKVSVTGSKDDVAQWKELVNRYLEKHDYVAAEGVVKKILEAAPTDEFAITLYEQMQDWKYLQIVNGVLVSYTGKGDRLVLPKGILEIGDEAFKGSSIRHIEFQEGVTKIGKGAFAGCELLEIDSLPSTLKAIEERAFQNCHKLNVQIPETVNKLGDWCFANCAIQEADLSNITHIGCGLFSGCVSLNSIVMPPSTNRIPDYMLAGTGIAKFLISSNIEEVGCCSFQGCHLLKEVDIERGLKVIHWCAFADCDALEAIDIPEGVKSIEQDAFKNCSQLRSISIPDGIRELGHNAFGNCIELEEVFIPASISASGTVLWDQFEGCKSIRTVKWSNIDRYYDVWLRQAYCDDPIELRGAFAGTPFWKNYIKERCKKQADNYQAQGRCRSCGGEFKGFLRKVCSRCGREKDY